MTHTTSDTPATVTVIGLGLMGQALARAFLTAGHPTTVWNRTAAKAYQLVSEGAELAPTVGDAVRPDSLTVICLTDYHAVRELLGTPDVDLDGTTLINLTSGDSAQARETAAWAEQRGARYLDGAIMAVPPAIGTPDAVILHSGPQSDFDTHKPTLDALGAPTYLGEDQGLASLYDVVGLAMMWSVLNAWLQGTALLRTVGVDAATYAPFARQMAAACRRLAARVRRAGRRRVLPRRGVGSGDRRAGDDAPDRGLRDGGRQRRTAPAVQGDR